MLLLGFVTVLVTALIPVVLWWFGAKQAKRDGALNERRTKTLDRQEQISRRQRRDSLLEIVDRSSDATHLGLLWREVGEYEGEDRELLLSVFRTNVALALPGSSNGVKVADDLTDTVVAHYVSGLERRYAVGTGRHGSYPGLLDFVVTAKSRRAKIEAFKVVALVTGATSEYQRPSHGFYRDLVNALPESAGGLLNAVENIDYRSAGGLRLNVLTGTLLALKDVELERFRGRQFMQVDAIHELRYSASVALATLLHRDNLRSFDRWSLEGSTEPVSATVAWLIRAVGWLADVDDHLAMRMIQNLADAIESIPDADRRWGTDAEDVRQGFESIMQKQPALWGIYGSDLEAAATSIGAWKAKTGKK
ncbi:hypothetical protein [Streptomyces sp. NPDC052042]|uniref:hypothetical protein n=1 Tax=Streptomyces sp. NPDC052042 TaxID=3365683 RepID=UPI0037D08DAF